MKKTASRQNHFSEILTLFFISVFFLGFFLASAEPAAASTSGGAVIGVQLSDYNSGACGQPNVGTQQLTPDSTSGGSSANAYDNVPSGTDFNCAKIYLDRGTDPLATDVRFCVQAVKGASNYGAEQCTGWASAGGGYSGWALDGSQGDIDGVKLRVDTRAMPVSGETISNLGFRWQQAKNAPTCGSNVGALTSATNGAWSSWITDGTQGDSNCIRLYLTGTVNPAPVIPTVLTFTANPTTITSGSTSTLTWTSANATSCTATGSGVGSGAGFSTGGATSGTDSVAPTVTTTYTVRCTSSTGNTASRNVTVTVSATLPPTVSLSASPASITTGNSSTLTWTVSRATGCTASGGTGWTGAKAFSGTSSQSVSPTTTTTYNISCIGAGGTTAASAAVTVAAAVPPTVTLVSADAVVVSGNSTTLTWTSVGANSCLATVGAGFSTSNAVNGSDSVTPTAPSTLYTVRCSNAYGLTSASVTVGVASTSGVDLISGTPALVSGTLNMGNSVRFSTVLTNQGTNNVGTAIYVLWQADFNSDGSWDSTYDHYYNAPVLGTLVAASSTTLTGFSQSQWTQVAGTHTIRACIDTYSNTGSSNHDRVAESNEGNNCSTPFSYTVAAADLVAGTPALTVASPAIGSTVSFTSSVTNQGTVTATSFSTLFELDENNNGSYDWTGNSGSGSVVGGGSQSFTPNGANSTSVNWTVVPGVHTVRACADNYYPDGDFWDNRILESDETDNCSTYTFSIAPEITFTASPTSVSATGASTLTWSSVGATSCIATGTGAGAGTGFATGGATSGTDSVTPGVTTTYTVSCSGAGGTTTATVTVTVVPPPTVTLSASPTSIVSGNSSTLSWTVSGATSCTASGGWAGAKAFSGTTNESVSPVTTTTYTISCDGTGGTTVSSATVTVTAPPQPNLTNGTVGTPKITSTGTLTQGQNVTFTSRAMNNGAASTGIGFYNNFTYRWGGVGGWTQVSEHSRAALAAGVTDTTDTSSSFALTSNGTLEIQYCVDSRSQITESDETDSCTVQSYTIAPLPAAPTVTFSASPTSIPLGNSSTLTWTVSGATSCTASGAADWTGAKAFSGTSNQSVSPGVTTTYTLSCTGAGGTTVRTAEVTVTAALQPNLTNGTVGTPKITSSGTLTQGQNVTFTSRAMNNGATSTGQGFYNNFTYRWGSSGAWTQISEHSRTALASGATHTTDTSSSFNLSGSGTLEIQYCVDSRGQITESTDTSADNCTVQSYAISALPNLTQPSITHTLSTGVNTATGVYDYVIVTFSTSNNGGSGTVANPQYQMRFDRGNNGYDETQTGSIGVLSAGANSANLSKTFNSVPFGTTTVEVTVDSSSPDLVDESNELDNVRTYSLGGVIPPPNPGIDISVDRIQVRDGETVNLTWNTNATFSMNCQVYGPGITTVSFNPSTAGATGSRTTGPINAKYEFTLKCTEPITATTFTDTVRVETAGKVEEI